MTRWTGHKTTVRRSTTYIDSCACACAVNYNTIYFTIHVTPFCSNLVPTSRVSPQQHAAHSVHNINASLNFDWLNVVTRSKSCEWRRNYQIFLLTMKSMETKTLPHTGVDCLLPIFMDIWTLSNRRKFQSYRTQCTAPG